MDGWKNQGEEDVEKGGEESRRSVCGGLIIDGWNNIWSGPKEGSVKMLFGLRAVSIWWMILFHWMAWYYSGGLGGVSELGFWNPAQLVARDMGVEMYFWVSGFVIAHIAGREIGLTGAFKPGLFLVSRLLRLAPAYWLFSAILAVGATSPAIPEVMSRRCAATWWAPFVFAENWVDFESLCGDWTWPVSLEMQLHVAAAGFFALVTWKRRVGWAALACSIVFCLVSRVVEVYWTGLDHLPADEGYAVWRNTLYTRTYLRAMTYILGMCVSMALDRHSHMGLWKSPEREPHQWPDKPLHGPTRWSQVGGVLCLLGAVLLVFVGSNPIWDLRPRTIFVVHLGLYRPLFGLVGSVFMYNVLRGAFPYLTSLLEWKGWYPVSVTSYSCYLVHVLSAYGVANVIAGTADTGLEFVQYTVFVGVPLTLVCAVPLYLLAEYPGMRARSLIKGARTEDELDEEEAAGGPHITVKATKLVAKVERIMMEVGRAI